MALNILAGWTFIVWVISLVWALTIHEGRPQEVFINRQSALNQEEYRHSNQHVSPVSSRNKTVSHNSVAKDDDIDIELF